jgi:hypothetical protein
MANNAIRPGSKGVASMRTTTAPQDWAMTMAMFETPGTSAATPDNTATPVTVKLTARVAEAAVLGMDVGTRTTGTPPAVLPGTPATATRLVRGVHKAKAVAEQAMAGGELSNTSMKVKTWRTATGSSSLRGRRGKTSLWERR